MTVGTSYSDVTLTLMIYSEDFGIEKLTFAVIKSSLRFDVRAVCSEFS